VWVGNTAAIAVATGLFFFAQGKVKHVAIKVVLKKHAGQGILQECVQRKIALEHRTTIEHGGPHDPGIRWTSVHATLSRDDDGTFTASSTAGDSIGIICARLVRPKFQFLS
jgi:hypothetical protein